ncbi:hypothetical protein [Streptomyces chartreusis]
MTTAYPTDGRLDGPIHTWFSLSYCNYAVLPRTLLQSMPVEFQERMVACLTELQAAFEHVPQAEVYDVKAATEHIVNEMSEAELAQAGIVADWYRGEAPPTACSPDDLAKWEAEHEDPEGPTYSRDGEELDGHERVLLPAADPVPHYNRGRAYIQPQPGLSRTWISPATGTAFDLHADYAVTRDQYDVLLKGEAHGYTGLVWRHFGAFDDGVPVLFATWTDGPWEQSIEGSIKLTDYEAALPPAACGKCKAPFDPDDTRFDGHARYCDTAYCRGCVDRCHDNEIADHRCVICA